VRAVAMICAPVAVTASRDIERAFSLGVVRFLDA